jgi:single-strand DNA-binding protein
MHTVVVTGRVGRDPEMRQTESGRSVTNFSVADNRRYTGGNGERCEETIWFRVAAWGPLAEVCSRYLSKGRQVAVQGRLRPDENGNPRIWNGNDGEARTSYELTASAVEFLDSKVQEDLSEDASEA